MQRPIDREELDRMVLRDLPAVLRFATRLTGNPQLAEEVVQQSMLRVLKRWQSYRAEAPFKTWWMRIVVNVYRDQQRGTKRSKALVDELLCNAASPEQQAAAAETSEIIQTEIQRLAPRQREVAIVCLCEQATARQAAAILGATENNIHATLHTVRRRLAEAIGLTNKQSHD